MEELLAKMAGLLQDIYDEGHGGDFRSSIQEVLVRYNAAQQPLALDTLYETIEQKSPCQACGATNTIRVPISRK